MIGVIIDVYVYLMLAALFGPLVYCMTRKPNP